MGSPTQSIIFNFDNVNNFSLSRLVSLVSSSLQALSNSNNLIYNTYDLWPFVDTFPLVIRLDYDRPVRILLFVPTFLD